ncbi:MAG: hypothetical protein U1F67_15975 [Rubrivivax sp.]
MVFFDTLADAALPSALDGLVIGGGFPETAMAALEANASMRASIRDAIAAGLPTYAECGGLMYLTRSITWRGQRRPVGAIAADTVMDERPVWAAAKCGARGDGRDAVARRDAAHAGTSSTIRASSTSTPASASPTACAAATAARRQQRDGLRVDNVLASYSHLLRGGAARA